MEDEKSIKILLLESLIDSMNDTNLGFELGCLKYVAREFCTSCSRKLFLIIVGTLAIR